MAHRHAGLALPARAWWEQWSLRSVEWTRRWSACNSRARWPAMVFQKTQDSENPMCHGVFPRSCSAFPRSRRLRNLLAWASRLTSVRHRSSQWKLPAPAHLQQPPRPLRWIPWCTRQSKGNVFALKLQPSFQRLIKREGCQKLGPPIRWHAFQLRNRCWYLKANVHRHSFQTQSQDQCWYDPRKTHLVKICKDQRSCRRQAMQFGPWAKTPTRRRRA